MQSNPPSRIKHFRLMVPIDRTQNSIVYAVQAPLTSQKMVIKLINHKNTTEERIERECSIQSSLRHPYIMPLFDFFDFQEFRVLLMPRARCSLLDIKISNPLAIAKIMFRTLEGIEYLHSMSILHGDIKPGNIVLKINDFDDPQPKIIDFGHANKLNSIDHLCRCHAMTYTYSSPELLSLQPHGLESDIWSLGATFFYLITKKELLVLKKIEEMRKDAANIRLSFQEKEWKNYPFSLRALISQMLNKDPNKRPRAEQCLTHQFFIEFLGKEWILREQERIKISKNIV